MRAWLQERVTTYAKWKPSEAIVNGVVYRNLVYLGKGSEAEVFMGQSDGRQFTIKIFHTHTKFRDGIEQAQTYQNWLPKLVGVDIKNLSIAMEYKAGIDVNTIQMRSGDFGISKDDRDRIWDLWQEWVSEQQKQFPTSLKPPTFYLQNAVYSFEEDTFFLIDAF